MGSLCASLFSFTHARGKYTEQKLCGYRPVSEHEPKFLQHDHNLAAMDAQNRVRIAKTTNPDDNYTRPGVCSYRLVIEHEPKFFVFSVFIWMVPIPKSTLYREDQATRR